MLRPLFNTIVNILRAPLWPVARLSRLVRLRRTNWIELRVPDQIVWTSKPTTPWSRWLRRRRPRLSLFALGRLFDTLARDSRRRGILVHLPILACGWAMADALAAELRRATAAGHEVRVFLPDGAGPKELLVAGAADQVALGEGASVHFFGIAVERRYLRGLLQRVGVRFQVWRRSEYKSAADQFTREGMSVEDRRQLRAIAQNLHDRVISSLDKVPAEARIELLERGVLDADVAAEIGLVSKVLHEDELQGWIAEGGTPRRPTPALSYQQMRVTPYFRPVRRRPYIAVVEAYGTIRSERRGAAWGRSSGTIQRLRQAAKDKRAAAIVLVVDSPGGSALASDQIHREIVRAMDDKPVIALLGNVAASGGYYIAAPAASIVAAPTTITGSIGVLGAKVIAEELFKKLGVGADVVKTAASADLYSSARAASPDEYDQIDRHLEHVYERFLRVVSSGRGQSIDRVREIAGGRVWTGEAALGHGLVDALGGRPEVAELLAIQLGRRVEDILGLSWRSVPGPRRPLGPKPTPSAARLWAALGLSDGVLDVLRDEPGPAYLAIGLPFFRQ